MSISQGRVGRQGPKGEQGEPVAFNEYSLGVVDGRTEHEKVEVVLSQGADGTRELRLILQGWGEGIGWYPQKTISLNPSQIGPLQRVLARARGLPGTKPPPGQHDGVTLPLSSLPPRQGG